MTSVRPGRLLQSDGRCRVRDVGETNWNDNVITGDLSEKTRMEIFTGWPGSHENPSRGFVTIEFCSHRARAKGTQVFVFIAFGQDQQQPFSNRNGAAASRAVKLGGIELFIGSGSAVGTGSATGNGESGLRLHRSDYSGYWLPGLNAFPFYPLVAMVYIEY